VRQGDGTVVLNKKTFLPAGIPTPHPPAHGPVVVDAGKWDGNGFLNSGQVEGEGDVFYKVTFTRAGTYKYECLIHPDMSGFVKVG
jgi:plastocyanin